MIIAGYPGIGKTTLSKYFPNMIDLDSDKFRKNATSSDWYIYYVNAALNIRMHNKNDIIFISTHKDVISYLAKQKGPTLVGSIYPSLELEDAWCEKLYDRILPENRNLDNGKYRTYLHVKENYKNDIEYFKKSWILGMEITSMDYDLDNIVNELVRRLLFVI